MDPRVEGKKEQAVGKVKETVGKIAGDRSTEWEGKAEQATGKVREAIGDAKAMIDEKIDEKKSEPRQGSDFK